MSSRAQVQTALAIFLDAHHQRCPDPRLLTIYEATDLTDPDVSHTTMGCASCGVTVTRRREGEDWSATWHWPDHDVIEHPHGCTHEPRAHSHDEHGDVQLQLVP